MLCLYHLIGSTESNDDIVKLLFLNNPSWIILNCFKIVPINRIEIECYLHTLVRVREHSPQLHSSPGHIQWIPEHMWWH